MAIVERGWSPPQLHDAFKYVQRRATRAVCITARGHWSNCDVYGHVPASWVVAGTLDLTLWALVGTARVPLVTVALSAVPSETVGGFASFLACSVRGRPCDGFEVTIKNNLNAVSAAGWLWAECWGTESTPENMGEQLGDAMVNNVAPSRAAHLMLWESVAGRWRRGRSDPAGRQLVQSLPAPLVTGTDAVGWANASAAATASAGACRALQVGMVNGNGAAYRYLQMWDLAAPPAVGTAAERVWPMPPVNATAGLVYMITFPAEGVPLVNGLVLTCSDTLATYQPQADGYFQWVTRAG